MQRSMLEFRVQDAISTYTRQCRILGQETLVDHQLLYLDCIQGESHMHPHARNRNTVGAIPTSYTEAILGTHGRCMSIQVRFINATQRKPDKHKHGELLRAISESGSLRDLRKENW